jgi:hypothetical protein
MIYGLPKFLLLQEFVIGSAARPTKPMSIQGLTIKSLQKTYSSELLINDFMHFEDCENHENIRFG